MTVKCVNNSITIIYDFSTGALEPDLFSKRGACVKAVQLAQDFQTLRQILGCLSFGEASKDGHYHVKLAGPDIASLTGGNYFSDFLQAVGDGVVDAVTWHQ